MTKRKSGKSKKVSSLLFFVSKRDKKKLRRIERKENLARVIELNREIQGVEPPTGLLDLY